MKILAIETSTLMGGVALTSENGLLAEFRLDVRTTHSEQLLATVDKVLKSSHTLIQEVEAFAVSIGPGSFTGIRIGISTVKGFAQVSGRPIFPVSTLEALAFGMPYSNHPICPVLDAKKDEIYTALFTFNGTQTLQRLQEDQVINPFDLADLISEPTIFLGNALQQGPRGWMENIGDKTLLAPRHLWAPSALWVAELARTKYRQGEYEKEGPILPNYIRRSEAEIKWEKRRQNTMDIFEKP